MSDSKVLKRRLASANGAITEIINLVTSGVDVNASPDTIKLAKAVLRKALCSVAQVHNIPTYYRHEWEQTIYKEYANGQLKSCSPFTFPAMEFAAQLEEFCGEFNYSGTRRLKQVKTQADTTRIKKF